MTALEGVRVLDLSTGIAGPVVGMLLGDHGADVIRIDGPDGDPQSENPGYAVWNRNKRSVFIDPTVRTGLDWLAKSVAGADVVILPAGKELADWGFRVSDAAARNTGLVTLRLPAYLDGAPAWIGGESNNLLAGYAGQAARQSSVTGGPIASMSPYLLYIHGIWAAACVVAALIERTVSGSGQVVTVTGLQAVLEATIGAVNVSPAAPDPDTAIGVTGRHPSYRHFVCGDGRWVSTGALGPKFEERFLQVFGLERILEDPRIEGMSARMALPENLGWVSELVEGAIASKDQHEVLELLDSIGVPCGPMNSREEWFASEQVASIGMRVEVEDPARGTVAMPGLSMVLTRTPGGILRPAPRPGAHNGMEPWSARTASNVVLPPRYVPGPLSGFHILNMGTFVASPYAGMLLSELGADVVKVEPYAGDPFRVSGYAYNRGMRSIAIDLASDEGRKAFHRIARDADVVMDAMRPGVMRKLGIDYDALVEENPRIVTQSLSAYGEGGPNAQRPGVDMVIQAESGMMSSWGGDDTPVANTIAINDVATAAMSSLVVLLGLHERQFSGQGQRAWNSLAATSVFLQMESVVEFDGRGPAPLGHRDFRGAHPLTSYYRTSDGWVGVDVPPVDRPGALERLAQAGLISDAATFSDDLVLAFEARTTAVALHELADIDIPSASVRTVSAVVRDPELIENEAFHIRLSDDGDSFVQTGRYAGFSRTQRRGPMAPPGAGEHSRRILAAAGYEDSEIDALVDARVVFAGGPVANILPIAYR